MENRFSKTIFENNSWKTVFGKPHLENRFWKTAFGKPLLEICFWKSVLWKTVFGKPFLENRFSKPLFGIGVMFGTFFFSYDTVASEKKASLIIASPPPWLHARLSLVRHHRGSTQGYPSIVTKVCMDLLLLLQLAMHLSCLSPFPPSAECTWQH